MKLFVLLSCATATYAASIKSLDDTECTKVTPGCPVGRCFGPPPDGCSFSKKLVQRTNWMGQTTCCPEMCVFRKDTSAGKGTGDQCYIRRTTATARTTPSPLPKCPEPCRGIFEGYKARGYSDKACIDFAKNGFMCSDSGGAKIQCDAEGFVKGKVDCVGGKVFTECGSACPLTCNNLNENTICIDMCLTGCFCSGAKAIWDEASEVCVDEDTCPGENQCEGTIGENYLNTGNLESVCKNTDDDDACYTSGCVEFMCVPDGDWDAGSKMDKVCGKSKDEADCVEGTDPKRKHCKWAVGTDAGSPPPVFLCSDGEWVLGKGACAFDEPAGVTTIKPDVEAACDFITTSGCYLQTATDKCDIKDPENSKCFGIVKTAYKNCQLGCLNFNSASTDPKCGECVEDALFNTHTIDGNRPDIYTCCSCLDAAFEAINVPASEVDRMLQLTCPVESYGGYDDVFDDDY